MGVPAWTTPTFSLRFSEQALDLTQAANVYVTFTMGWQKLTKHGSSLVVSEKQIDVHLSQEECGLFDCGQVSIQANWTDNAGDRCASDVAYIDITPQLLKEVIR